MREFFYQNEDAMIELLEKLVNIDSGTYVKHGVDQVGEILRKEYEKIGFQAEIYRQEKLGDNLVIRHSESRDPQIVVIAHMDTVFPEGTVAKRPFTRKGDYAYGPGVIDMKASHVNVLFAMKALKENSDYSFKNVVLILNTDEEIGSIQSREVIERIVKGKKYALILEPAQNGNLVCERKGGGKFFLTVTGKSAHAGVEPQKGISAIEELAVKILKLHKLTRMEEGLTVNVGLVKGGTSTNTVAPHAEASIDVRFLHAEQAIEIERAVREVCSVSDVPGTSLNLRGNITRPAWNRTPHSEKLINLVVQEGIKLGLTLNQERSGGGSDGNLTASLGVPTIDGLGPIGGNAHQESEYLYIPSLTERALLLAHVIRRLNNNTD